MNQKPHGSARKKELHIDSLNDAYSTVGRSGFGLGQAVYAIFFCYSCFWPLDFWLALGSIATVSFEAVRESMLECWRWRPSSNFPRGKIVV